MGVGRVGATSPGGFSFFLRGLVWQWWDFHACWDDRGEEGREGCAAEPCTRPGFPCPPRPPGGTGITEPGIWGQASLLSWGWAKPPPGLKGCPFHLQKKWMGHPSRSASHAPALACSARFSPPCLWSAHLPLTAGHGCNPTQQSCLAGGAPPWWLRGVGEVVVEKVAFPLPVGCFSRRLAKLLPQGLGYRRAWAGLEPQPGPAIPCNGRGSQRDAASGL